VTGLARARSRQSIVSRSFVDYESNDGRQTTKERARWLALAEALCATISNGTVESHRFPDCNRLNL
jgi:hypothetical protein